MRNGESVMANDVDPPQLGGAVAWRWARGRASDLLTGLLGYPLGHSVSPAMHNAAFQALGLDGRYDALPTPPERLAETVAGLAAAGYRGVNVTIPHKQAVMPLLDELSDAAQAIGAVNTIVVEVITGLAVPSERTRPGLTRSRNQPYAATTPTGWASCTPWTRPASTWPASRRCCWAPAARPAPWSTPCCSAASPT